MSTEEALKKLQVESSIYRWVSDNLAQVDEPVIEDDDDEDDKDDATGANGSSKQSRSEKNSRKAMLKLGMKPVPGVSTIKRAKNAKIEDLSTQLQQQAAQQFRVPELGSVVSKPEDSAPTSARADEEDEDVDDSGVEPRDIDLVMTQASVSRGKAVKALKANNGDIVSDMASADISCGERTTRDLLKLCDIINADPRAADISEMDVLASDMCKLDVVHVPERLITTVEDKVEDARGGAACDDAVLIRSLACRVGSDGDGHALISSLDESFLCSVGNVLECQSCVIRDEDLYWDTSVRHKGCEYVVCGGTVFLVGGLLRGPDIESHYISKEMHFINLDAENPRWEVGPPMSVGRLSHAAVSLNDKIYVFGGRSGRYITARWCIPWAEVYDIKEKKWSILKGPRPLLKDEQDEDNFMNLSLRCCVVEEVGNDEKKIIVYNGGRYCHLYDPNSDEWEEYNEKWTEFIPPLELFKIMQSGRLLFFICNPKWWVFDLDSKQMWGAVGRLNEMIGGLGLPKYKYLAGVQVLGCSSCYIDDELGMIEVHDFVNFYGAAESIYYYVVRIDVIEYRAGCRCVAMLRSLGVVKCEGGFTCDHFYAAPM